MNAAYDIEVVGLANLPDNPSDRIQLAAVRAINKTVDRARTASARRIREQVNLPATYLNRQDRLGVTKRAQRGDLEAVITGRHRPTSLATFALNTRQSRKPGVNVMVKPGHATFLPKAFFVRLRSGNSDTKNNLGLAVRLPVGKRPSAAYKPTPLGRGLWLLYGPSLASVFDDVAQEISPDTADYLESEFLRVVDLGI